MAVRQIKRSLLTLLIPRTFGKRRTGIIPVTALAVCTLTILRPMLTGALRPRLRPAITMDLAPTAHQYRDYQRKMPATYRACHISAPVLPITMLGGPMA